MLLTEKIARMQQSALERPKPRLDPVPATTESPVYQMPLWPDETRGVPNALLRSALFSATVKSPRRYLDRELLHAQAGIQIRYSGPGLGQSDLDAWETVLHLARCRTGCFEIRTTSYQLLKLQGKRDGGANRSALYNCIVRLKASAVEIAHGPFCYVGSLIDEAFRDTLTNEYVIRLNPRLCCLFAHGSFSRVDWKVRRSLSGKPLAQWLHGYFSSHAKPFPIGIETLLRLSGSNDQSAHSGSQNLRRALDALAHACADHAQSFRYSIRSNTVHVLRQPTKAQRNHLRNQSLRSQSDQ